MLIAQGTEPAGGAATGEIMIATGAAMVVTTALLVLGMGHRAGRVGVLDFAGRIGTRVTGLPGWVAFPSGLATVSLITAVIGMYWDIALHIGVGRDEGPLANPAHYFILAGLFGIFAAGFFAIVMPKDNPGPTSIRIGKDWHAPLGGVLICACGAFSLIGFPLDDVWHRLFGQDVTLWGPTHLMLIGGAAMTLVGIAVLLVEGARSVGVRSLPLVLTVPLCGGLLLGLATFQAEFDFGVPQFRFVFQPILIMLAAGVGLVAARVFAGRGAALGAVVFFLAVRGALALLVGPVLGETTPHMPLFVVEALVVEAIALRVLPSRAAAGVRPLGRRGHRHCRPGLRMGLVARVDAVALAVRAVPRGCAAGLRRRHRRRPAGRLGRLAPGADPRSRPALAAPRRRGRRRRRGRAGGLRAVQARRRGRPRPGCADRRPRRTRPHRERRRAAEPCRRGRRRRVADRDRLAGRRPRGRPPAQGRPRPLPHHRADPGARQLEGADPPAPRQLADRGAGVPAARPGHSRPRRCRPAMASRAASWPTTRSSSASRRRRRRGLAVAAYLVVVAIALALLALLVWGLHRLAGGGAAPPRPPREPAARAPELAGTHA